MLTVNCTSRPTAADTVEAIIASVIGSNSHAVSTAAELKKSDLWPCTYAEMNCASRRPTAADTIEEIIASHIGVDRGGMSDGAAWKKVGSRTSVCSDNTSDTLSADEGQRDEDEMRPRQMRTEKTSASTVSGTVLPVAIDHARNGCGPALLPTSSTSGTDMGVFSSFLRQSGNTLQMPQTKEPLSSFSRHFTSSKPLDTQHSLANGDSQPVMPAGSLMASMLGRSAHTLRVRDVIHTAIEENLQSRSSPSASLDNLWQLYSQNRGLLPVPRSAVTADAPNESAQDLSCRNREPRSAVGKAAPVPQNCVGPLGVVSLLSSEKSPPPAHSHYGRPPIAVIPPPPPIIDRCQDPLYHLAEVAVQRGRVEVSGDRHRSSPTPGVGAGYGGQPVLRPSVHSGELDRSEHGVSAPLPGGSITLGTPRHLMAADILSKPPVPVADVSQRNLPQHAAKVKDSVELAQEALRYLGQPDSSQRAVMERVMAQVVGSFASPNPSHTILMGDYVTAQQMQTSQYQQLTQPPKIPSHRYQHRQPVDHRAGVRDHVSLPCIPDLLDGTRMADVSVNHMPVIHNRPNPPERPQHTTPSSQFIRRPLTAANVIDAIITHQINKEVPMSGTSIGTGGTVLTRLPEPRVMSLNSQRAVNVNGSVQPDSNLSGTDSGRTVYPPRHSIAEQLEKERSSAANSYPSVTVRSQEVPKTTASSMSVAQLVTRAVTLGEHIDKMIQKDFNIPTYDRVAQTALDVMRNGATVDTKNALRTFLTSSNDFSSEAAVRQRESVAPMACTNSPSVSDVTLTSSTHNYPPPLPASTASLQPAHSSANHEVQSASSTAASSASQSLPTSRVETNASLQKSPRQSAACLPAAAIFPAITDISRFSINSTGYPPLAVPVLVAGPQPVEPGIRGRQIFGTLPVTGVPQPSSALSSVVLPAGFVAGSALRLPVAPLQPGNSIVTTTNAVLHSDVVERSPVTSQALTTDECLSGERVDQSDHQDVSSPVNWKLKMARDHQRQEQERSKSSASFAVNEAPSTDVVVRVACDAVQLGSVSSVTTTATCSDTLPTRPLIPFGPVWLSSSISRDGSGDTGSASSICGSPRSPRTGSCQPEKTMSAIAATHQTMTSLLSKPRCVDFPVEKVVTLEGPADSACVPPSPALPVSAATSCSAASTVVSEVIPPSSPVASDAEFSPAPVSQLPPSLHAPSQSSPADQLADAGETPAQTAADTETEDASLMDKTCLSSPPNDVTSPPSLTKAESSSHLQDATDDTSVSVPVSESS